MARRRYLAAAVVVAVAASMLSGGPTVLAAVPEVVFASDFEDGTTGGWHRRGTTVLSASTDRAHTGTYSLLSTGRTAGWHGPAVDLQEVLLPGALYQVDAHVLLVAGQETTPLQLTMQRQPESTGTTVWEQVAQAPTVTADDWAVLSGQYGFPEPGFQLELYIESPDPDVSYYVDNVTITMLEPPPDTELPPVEAGSIDFTRNLQHIDGFGFSETFQRAAAMNGLFGLPEEKQREVVDLLLNPETGAGLSILRLGIGSSPNGEYANQKSIQPEDPGGPDAPPRYVWDGYDNGQVWLAKHAKNYGVERFYASAWAAPGYMKTNGVEADGGELCGVPNATNDCDGEDWRQAYADYLMQYVRFYAQEGIRITDLGFTNEPDLTVDYASMRFDNQ